MSSHAKLLNMTAGAVFLVGCSGKYREDLDYSHNVEQVMTLDDVSFGELTQFETVPLDLDNTVSLRRAITRDNIANGRDVLEIGTNTGLIAVLCAQGSANRVLAVAKSPVAVANAQYNAAALAVDEDVQVRLLSPTSTSLFGALEQHEKFDLIIITSLSDVVPTARETSKSDSRPLEELLGGLPQHLNSGGRCMVSCSHSPTVRALRDESVRRGWELKIMDNRDLDTLDDNFVPGMLLEIRVPDIPETQNGDVTQEPKST